MYRTEKVATKADSFDSVELESDDDPESSEEEFDDESGDDESTQSTSEADTDASPPRPPPNYTGKPMSSPGSVSIKQTVGENGERIWITETVLLDGNIQRITTSTPPPDLENGLPSVRKEKDQEEGEQQKAKCCDRFDSCTKAVGCLDSIMSLVSTFKGGLAFGLLIIIVASVTTGVVLSNNEDPTPTPIITIAPTTQSPITNVPTTNAPDTQEPTPTQSPITMVPTTNAPNTQVPTPAQIIEDNDFCDDAIFPAFGKEIVGTTFNATGVDAEFYTCGLPIEPSVWYKFTGTGERMSVSTCSHKTNIDTKIAVYSTDICADDTCMYSIPYFLAGGEAGGVLAASSGGSDCTLSPASTSSVIFDSVEGQGYKLLVAGYALDGAESVFGLTVTSHSGPENDECSRAKLIQPDGGELLQTTTNAAVSTEMDSCFMWRDPTWGRSLHIQGATLWYRVIGTGKRITISTCSGNTNIDTKIAVYATSSCADHLCMYSIPYFANANPVGGGPLASNEDDPDCILTVSKASTVEFDSELGHEYKFYVADTYGRLDGSFGLTVTSHSAPENDECSDSKLIEPDGVELIRATTNATISTEMDSCFMWRDPTWGSSLHIQGATVWYRVLGTGERISITTCSDKTNIDTKIAVYATSACADHLCMYSIPYFASGGATGGPLASNEEDPDCVLTFSKASTVVFDSEPGREYKFYVANTYGRRDGTFGLTVTSHSAPGNDACSKSKLVQSDGVELPESTVNATVSTEMDSCFMWRDPTWGSSVHIQGATLWYRVIGTGKRISISTCSNMTNIDTKIAVYATSSCADQLCMYSIPYFANGEPYGGPIASNEDDLDCILTPGHKASTVVFDSELGQEYKFYVADAQGRLDGTFGLTVTSYATPSNDACSSAKPVDPNGVELVESTENATISTEFDSCFMWREPTWGGSLHIQGSTVWYKLLGTGERFTISTCSEKTNIDTKIAVYANDGCGDDTCVDSASNDNDPDCILTNAGASTVSFDTEAGVSYKFYVADSHGRLDGTFGLKVDSEVIV